MSGATVYPLGKSHALRSKFSKGVAPATLKVATAILIVSCEENLSCMWVNYFSIQMLYSELNPVLRCLPRIMSMAVWAGFSLQVFLRKRLTTFVL